MRKLLWGLPALAVATFAVFAPGAQGDVQAQDPGIVIDAGDGEVGYSVNQFLPGTVTVAEGTTVTWQFPWMEPHIVAFVDGAPPAEPAVTTDAEWPNDEGYVYSGDVFGNPDNPPTFSVTFPEAGTYQYFCPIHPLMVATVEVVADGEDVDTQADVDARAEAEYATNLAAVKAVAAAANADGGSVTPRPDGTKLFEVIVGAVDASGNDAQQFFPGTANINAGDTVKWISTNQTPHTVTFNPPDVLQGDPFALPRSADTEITDQTEIVNSGILWTVPGQPNSYTEYELTFPQAGTYTYVCILHAPQGMVGTINVAAQTTPTATATATSTATATATSTATSTATATSTSTTAPKPPTTGNGDEAGSGANWLLIAGAAAAFLAASGAFGAATLRRR